MDIWGIIIAVVLAAIIMGIAGIAVWAKTHPSQDPDNEEAMKAIR